MLNLLLSWLLHPLQWQNLLQWLRRRKRHQQSRMKPPCLQLNP